MKKRRIFRNLNDKEFAWVLYDVGNSAYTMLACALIPDGDCGDHDRGCAAGSDVCSDF